MIDSETAVASPVISPPCSMATVVATYPGAILSGAAVFWSSQAGGRVKAKTGKVVAFVPAGMNALAILVSATGQVIDESDHRYKSDGSRFRGQRTSLRNRYLIAVEEGTRVKRVVYYLPLASVVERQNAQV